LLASCPIDATGKELKEMDSSSDASEPFLLLKLAAAQEMGRQVLEKLIALTQTHDRIPWKAGIGPSEKTVELAQSFSLAFTLFQYEVQDCKDEIADCPRAMLIWEILNKVILDVRYVYWANAMIIYYKTQEINPSRAESSLDIRTRFIAKVQDALAIMLQPKIYRMAESPAFLQVCEKLIPEISMETKRSAERFAEIADVADPIINWLERYGLDIY
jgi:hypothetical protein